MPSAPAALGSQVARPPATAPVSIHIIMIYLTSHPGHNTRGGNRLTLSEESSAGMYLQRSVLWNIQFSERWFCPPRHQTASGTPTRSRCDSLAPDVCLHLPYVCHLSLRSTRRCLPFRVHLAVDLMADQGALATFGALCLLAVTIRERNLYLLQTST